jgi:hypothetical protein
LDISATDAPIVRKVEDTEMKRFILLILLTVVNMHSSYLEVCEFCHRKSLIGSTCETDTDCEAHWPDLSDSSIQ